MLGEPKSREHQRRALTIRGLSRSGGAYCLGDFGQDAPECGQTVIVHGNDGDGGMALLRREALISGHEGGESVQIGLRQQLVVTQHAPMMEDRALDWRAAKRGLEG